MSQRTCFIWQWRRQRPLPQARSFLVLFFKKEPLALLLALLALPAFGAGDCGTVVLPTGIGVATSADLTSFNPLLGNSAYNIEAAGLMYLNLFWLNGFTGRIDFSRSLASAVTTPDNGTTYDVTLRDWNWSDGVPITSADAAFTLKIIRGLGDTYINEGYGGMPGIIKTFTIIDAKHFQVVLTHQVNPTWYIYNGLNQLAPLPVHAWGRDTLAQIWQGQSSPAFFRPVDGPLALTRFEPGLDAVFAPNPAWQGAKLHFKRLILKFMDGDGAEVQQVESGDLDAADIFGALLNAVHAGNGLHIVTDAPLDDYNEIIPNIKNPAVPFFADTAVRDAIQDAINQPELVRLVFHGLAEPILGPVPPNMSAFLPPHWRPSDYAVGYNPAKARALLAAAGYAPGPDGILQKHGRKLAFIDLMLTGDATIQQQTEFIQADLAKVGIQMKVREIEFNQMLALLDRPGADWQAAELAENYTGYPTGEEVFQTGSPYNEGGYSNPEMDRLIAASTSAPGLGALYAYENFAAAQQPVIFFGVQNIVELVRNRISGVAAFVDPFGTYYPDALICKAGA